jgi:Na+/alanine symporter
MIKTFSAFKYLISSKIGIWVYVVLLILGVISSSVFVLELKNDLQDSVLSITSIIFPLIAGFLTFGRDTLREIKKSIAKIIESDKEDKGISTTITDKKRINRLKGLSDKFIDVVVSTFVTSFILIIGLLISKINNLNFKTSSLTFDQGAKDYLINNWFNLSIKSIFFFFIFTLFLNALYLTVFIIKITKEDELISK